MKKAMITSLILCVILCSCGKEPGVEGDKQVLAENAWNIYTYSETEAGYRYTMNEYAVSDEEELKALLEKSENELRVPSYIPEGYAFENASLAYYVTKEMLDGLSPEEKEENGSTVYEYILPDEVLTQIDGFYITYVNQKGEKLVVDADYVISMELDTGNHDFEEVEAVGYEAARTGIKKEGAEGEFFRKVRPIYAYTGNSEVSMDCIFVNIRMAEEKEDEVIKIAESM